MNSRVVMVVTSFPKLSESFIVGKFLGLLRAGWDAHIVCAESKTSEWGSFSCLRDYPGARSRVHVNWPHRPRWLAALLGPVALSRCLVGSPAGTSRFLRAGIRRFGLHVFRKLYLDSAILALRPDVIHFEFGALAVGRTHLGEFLNCALVVSFRGYDLNHAGLQETDYLGDIWQRAHAVHVLSQDLWKKAQARGCPATKPHWLIPPAIDARAFDGKPPVLAESDGSSARPIRILSVGRLEWQKGYEYAIDAIRCLRDLGIHCEYRIVGQGGFLEPIAFGCHQLAVQEQVRLLGPLTQTQIREQMLMADIFLHAAVSEGFCNAVLEAQAMALPVVCSDAGGLPENVVEGETGLVVPRRNPSALAEKLAFLARNPVRRRAMGEAGRRRVMAQFQIERQVSAFEEMYRAVMNNLPEGPQVSEASRQRCL